jgi:tetratricopeptide (TPR) repeat protein
VPSRDQIVSDVLELIADESLFTEDNDEFQLLRLAQALRNTASIFGLFFAVCNNPRMSRILAGRLRDILPAGESLVEVQFTGDEPSLLDRLRLAPGTPAPLSVYGIERLLPSSEEQGTQRQQTLQELQVRREQFRSLSRPLIFWMPEYAYILIGQKAVDFWSWQSGAFFFDEKAIASVAGNDKRVDTRSTDKREAVSSSPLLFGQLRVLDGARKALRDGQSVMLLGSRGIGKSTLALRLAHELRSDFQDRVLFLQVPAGGDVRESVKNALRAVIQAAHPDIELSDDLAVLVSLYRHTFGGNRTLIVLDDVESPDVVKALLPTPPGSALLVTSNRVRHSKLPGVLTFVLDRLMPEEARELLLGIAPNTPVEVADEICSLCDNMPLAIHLAGGLLSSERSIRPATLIKLLREEGRDLSEREWPDVPNGVAASLRASYKLLRPDTARILRQLSVFTTSFDMRAAQSVCGPGSLDIIDELGRRALVIFYASSDRFVLHPLIRSFVAAVSDEEERYVAAARHATHFEVVLRHADEMYQLGGSEVQEALSLFDLEWENIQAGQAWAAAHYQGDAAMAELCIAYPNSGRYLLELRQPPDLRIRWIEAALTAVRKLGRTEVAAVYLYALGLAYEDKGDYRRAISLFEEAQSISQKAGFRDVEDATIASLGRAYQELGETQRAVEFFEQALAAARARGDIRSESTLLNSMGSVYLSWGEARRGINYFEHALELARKMGNRRNESVILGSLSNAYLALGDYHKAIDIFKQSMTASRELGFKHGEATSLNNMGIALLNIGEMGKAVEATEQALRIFHEIGDRHGEARALGNLGLALAEQGKIRNAIKHYEQQLVIDREIGDRHGEANALGNLGTAYSSTGDNRRALKLLGQALNIFREIGNRYGEVSALSSLAGIYESMGDHERALETFERALSQARETNNAPEEGIVLHNIGNVYTKLGDLPRALEYYTEALNNFRKLGNRRDEALALNNISLTLYDMDRRKEAISAAENALKIYEQLKDPRGSDVQHRLTLWLRAA